MYFSTIYHVILHAIKINQKIAENINEFILIIKKEHDIYRKHVRTLKFHNSNISLLYKKSIIFKLFIYIYLFHYLKLIQKIPGCTYRNDQNNLTNIESLQDNDTHEFNHSCPSLSKKIKLDSFILPACCSSKQKVPFPCLVRTEHSNYSFPCIKKYFL